MHETLFPHSNSRCEISVRKLEVELAEWRRLSSVGLSLQADGASRLSSLFTPSKTETAMAGEQQICKSRGRIWDHRPSESDIHATERALYFSKTLYYPLPKMKLK